MAGSSAVRAAFAELHKDLAANGFIADRPTLYLRSDLGDYVVVELQRSNQYWHDRLPRVYVNMAAVPAPQWDWLKTLYPSRHPGATHPCAADRVWDQRLRHDTGGMFTDETWTPTDDTKEAGAAMGQLIAAHLRPELPFLLSLLDRDVLLAQLARWGTLPRLQAMMLADAGPSPELDHLLGRLEPDDDNMRRFVDWALNYAAGRRAD